MAARTSRPTPYLHVRELSRTEDAVRVACTKADCHWATYVPVGPNAAAAVFAAYNAHLRTVRGAA